MSTVIKKRKKTFVLIIPRFEDIDHSFYAGEIIRGACLAASRINVDILVHITDREDHRKWLDSSLLDRRYVDGIMFADIDNDIKVVKKVINHGMPCITLNNVLNMPINWIAVDNRQAAFNVVDYFIKQGHEKIATIAGDLSTQAGHLRLDGFKQALKVSSLKCPKNYVVYGHFLRTPAREAAEKLLNLKDRPTAIFAASDVMALELIDAAKKKEIHIPNDLSIIGFDNNPLNGSSPIKLTTVSQPLTEMGRLGVENLHQICLGKAKLPVKIMLPTELIVRRSVVKH